MNSCCKFSTRLPSTSDLVNSLLEVITSKPIDEFITAFIHLTHSICSRASVNFSPFPEDSDVRPSSKQSNPPRLRNSLSHFLFAFSSRGRMPEKFFSDGVCSNFTHNSGSASAMRPLIIDDTSFFSPENLCHFDLDALRAAIFVRRRNNDLELR